MDAHIVFEDVSFHWPQSDGTGAGFSGVCCAVQRGEFAVLTGPSGQGKSTLLRLLVRFEEVQQGRICLAGQDVRDYAPELLRRRVGLVQQSPVMGAPSVRTALLLPFTFGHNADMPHPDDVQLRTSLDAVRLEGVSLDAESESLSLGQKQRVALARTLLLQPEVLLLDEPTSALDIESRQAVEAEVEAVHRNGTTVIMVTHTDYRPACAVREWHLRDGCLSESLPEQVPERTHSTEPAATEGKDHE